MDFRWPGRDTLEAVIYAQDIVESSNLVRLGIRPLSSRDGNELTFCSKVSITSLRCSARTFLLATADAASKTLY